MALRLKEPSVGHDRGFSSFLSSHCLEPALLKRPEDLSENQAVKLSELLKYNLKSVRSYLLEEYFHRVWEYRYGASAGRFLDAWCTRAMRSQLAPMKSLAKTPRNKRSLLLNSFRVVSGRSR